MKSIVIFGSGTGSNLQNIITYFTGKCVKIRMVVSDKPNSGCIDIAKCRSIPYHVLDDWSILKIKLLAIKPDLIVLAGFVKKIPAEFISTVGCDIINIHPSLLPKYGGKGMYGSRIHDAVINNKEKFSGITIHYVNENYDEGAIILQKEINVEDMSLDQLQNAIHKIEWEWYPKVIEELLECK